MLMIVKVFGEVMIVTEVTVDHQVYGEVFNVVNKMHIYPPGLFSDDMHIVHAGKKLNFRI